MATLTREEYQAKREARIARLLAAADRADQEGAGARDRAHAMAEHIPFGQPILIGHHSERRDRNYRARIESTYRKGWELYEKARDLRSRAASAEDNDSIMSDDPDAIQKIGDKLADMLKLQAEYKAVNKAHAAYLKDPASLDKSDLPEDAKALIRNYVPQYRWEPHPIPPYRLTNLSANIRRLKEREQIVTKKQAMEDKQEMIGDIKIEYAPGENRIRIYYPARVDLETYKRLQQHGFRPLRSAGEGAFSGYYNNNCLYFVRTYIKK